VNPPHGLMASPNPLAGNQADPEAMSAYATEMQAAYARLLQRCAPQQHAVPMYAPASSMPLQQQQAMPMHFPVSPVAYVPPSPVLSKKLGTAASRRAQAADTGSLWTNVLFLLTGVVIGVACAGQSSTPPVQQSPQQQLCQ